MLVTLPGITIDVNVTQSENVLLFIVLSFLPSVTVASLLHPENAFEPIDVTLSLTSIPVNKVQP